jgi:hypothetical protein
MAVEVLPKKKDRGGSGAGPVDRHPMAPIALSGFADELFVINVVLSPASTFTRTDADLSMRTTTLLTLSFSSLLIALQGQADAVQRVVLAEMFTNSG